MRLTTPVLWLLPLNSQTFQFSTSNCFNFQICEKSSWSEGKNCRDRSRHWFSLKSAIRRDYEWHGAKDSSLLLNRCPRIPSLDKSATPARNLWWNRRWDKGEGCSSEKGWQIFVIWQCVCIIWWKLDAGVRLCMCRHGASFLFVHMTVQYRAHKNQPPIKGTGWRDRIHYFDKRVYCSSRS